MDGSIRVRKRDGTVEPFVIAKLRNCLGNGFLASGEMRERGTTTCQELAEAVHAYLERTEPHEIVKLGVAHVPEGRRIFPRLTVLENLKVGAYTRRARSFGDDLDLVFAFFPRLKERKRQMAGTLSGGEQQMLAIGRGLMARPKLLLLDEPSMGLAPLMVEQIFTKIGVINREGVTVLLVEQNAAMALAISQRGYVLETGKVILEGTSMELAANDQVRQAYLGG